MVTKTYNCPVHGEFDIHTNMNGGELKTCPMVLADKPSAIIDVDATIVTEPNPTRICDQPVTRVYKKLTYMDTEGFCGKVYGSP